MTRETRDDRTLLRLAQADASRRSEVFGTLYERHADEVFGFLCRLLGDESLAEDVHQEAFFRVHRGLDGVDPGGSCRAWIFQIARNAAVDALRLRQKDARLRAGKLARDEAPSTNPVLREVDARERAERARVALDALPPDAKALLLQRHGLGMKLEELAASWSCTERTIRNRLRAAAGALAGALGLTPTLNPDAGEKS